MPRQKGQRSAPGHRRDEIAEKLADLGHLVLDAHEANLVHARAQLTRLRSMGDLVKGIDTLFRAERAAELDAETEARRTSREASRPLRAVG